MIMNNMEYYTIGEGQVKVNTTLLYYYYLFILCTTIHTHLSKTYGDIKWAVNAAEAAAATYGAYLTDAFSKGKHEDFDSDSVE